MKKKWSAALQIAAVYVGTVVGAGFATGKEIVEFFTQYGFIGLVGILFSGYLFILLGSRMMVISANINATSYQELNTYLFGKTAAKFINIFMLVMLLLVCSVMLSGSGAVFSEQLLLSKHIGIFITIGLTIFFLLFDSKGIFIVNTFAVPIMISFSFLLLLFSITQPHFVEQALFIPPTDYGYKAVIAPFSYAALNLALASAVLVPIASEVKDIPTIKLGAKLGGLFLTMIMVASHLTLIMLPNVTEYSIPMATIMKQSIQFLFWIYILVIFAEILTSVIGNVFGLQRQISQYIKWPKIVICLIIISFCSLLSLVEYKTLLSILYPILGYLSIIFLVLLWQKKV